MNIFVCIKLAVKNDRLLFMCEFEFLSSVKVQFVKCLFIFCVTHDTLYIWGDIYCVGIID